MSNNQEKLNEQLVKVVLDTKTCDEVRIKRAKYLIRLGADINARNDGGKTVLTLARDSNDECMIILFESLGAKEGEVPSKRGDGLVKRFWDAYGRLKSAKEIEVLIQQGAYLEQINLYGETALMFASKEGRKETVQLLLDRGADVNQKGWFGWTALMIAVERGQEEIVEMLLDRGADVNPKDSNGMTALMWAAYHGRKEIAQMLLEKGADVNQEDCNGMTALMRASKNGDKEVVEVLLEGGADVHQKDNDGETALMKATDKETKKVIKKHIKKTKSEVTNGWLWDKIFGGLTR